MLAYIFLESRKKLFKKRGIQYNKSINIDGSKVKLKTNVDTILIGAGPMEEGKEGGCQLERAAFVGLEKNELNICGKARTLLDAEAGSEGNPPYPDGPQEGKWNFAKAAGRAAVTVVVIGGTAVVVCASMGASTPVIAGAAVTAGMAGGGMMVSDAIQGKVSSLEDYALSVASAELMFFTNQAMTHLITVTGMGFVSGTVAKAAGEAAAGAALDYLVAGEVDYERLARNLAINVVVDLGTGVLTGEAWEKPRQRTVEGRSGTSLYGGKSAEEINNIMQESSQKRLSEILDTQSKTSAGPCLSEIYDPLTDKIAFGQNFKTSATGKAQYYQWLENDADPLIRELVKNYEKDIKTGKVLLSEVADTRLAAHSEIVALDKILKNRRSLGLTVDESTLSELYLYNIDLTKAYKNGQTVPKIRCEHCRRLTTGINTLGHN